ncbi:hypothetical protein [Sphaerisporangium sp. TRM90804]|uniref:hypothetical protein n=1 Tax=Sphaerisporangium sp. TRM90804 TaxID=3031113 RepID=UPI00244A9AF8|nr:hypothetical protein [Sphaerisporangium sp. TRM90804]MDH2429575.1 hypothetical protein [Sphaerisporangium sp. TRM90804]
MEARAAKARVAAEHGAVEGGEPVEAGRVERRVPAEPRLAEERVAAHVRVVEGAVPQHARAVQGQLAAEPGPAEGGVARELGAEERGQAVEPGVVEGRVPGEDRLAEPGLAGEDGVVEPRPARPAPGSVQDTGEQLRPDGRAAQVDAPPGGQAAEDLFQLGRRQVRHAAPVRVVRDARARGRGAAGAPADVQGRGVRRGGHGKGIPIISQRDAKS